jgi:uncharacterized phage protein (TIGR01671 family)
MQREIKFRAWDSKNMYKSPSSKEGLQHLGSWFDAHSTFSPNGNEKDAIIMQFTGLTDKNDKPIFEGDILEFREIAKKSDGSFICLSDHTRSLVIFRDGVFGVKDFTLPSSPLVCPFKGIGDISEYKYIDYRVIGDKFSNPELLTK